MARLLYLCKTRDNNNDRWQAGGIDIEIVEPAEKVLTRYNGRHCFSKPTGYGEPEQRVQNNPSQVIKIDLEHNAVGPLYHVGEPGDGNELQDHTEQHESICADARRH